MKECHYDLTKVLDLLGAKCMCIIGGSIAPTRIREPRRLDSNFLENISLLDLPIKDLNTTTGRDNVSSREASVPASLKTAF